MESIDNILEISAAASRPAWVDQSPWNRSKYAAQWEGAFFMASMWIGVYRFNTRDIRDRTSWDLNPDIILGMMS